MDSPITEPSLPPEIQVSRFWHTYRPPIFLASLVLGLVGFLIWLPGVPRANLIAALMAQQVLMSMLCLFALVVLSMVWSAGQRLDVWIFTSLNLRGYHRRWLDRVMWMTTQIGNMVTAIFLAGLSFIMNMRSLTIVLVFGTITLWLLVEVIKALTDRARPFLSIAGTRVIGWKEPGRSFPSGHTAQTFFLMTLFSHQFHLGIGAALFLYAIAFLVGFTRIYVGAHYPRDVIGGAVLGSIWGVLTTLVDPYWFGIWM